MKFIILATCLVELGLAVYYLRLFFQKISQIILVHLLMLAGILLYCAGGTFLAYVTVSATDLSGMLMWRRIGDEHIFAALIITLCFALFVHWLAMRLSQYVGIPAADIVEALDRVSLNPYAFAAVSIVVLGAYAALTATGKLTFHGTESEQQSADAASSPLLMVAYPVLFVMPILCGYRIFVRGKLFQTILVLAMSTGFALFQGRRNLIMFLFFAIIGYALNRRLEVTKFVKGMVIASMIGLGILGFMFSFAMRMATWYSTPTASVVQRASLALEMMVSGSQDKKTNIADATQGNVGLRAFNPILFIATLASADRSQTGAMGEVMVNGAAYAVPNFFWRQKDLFTRSEEEIAGETMHVPVSVDEAETIMSGAYNDFREAGILVYGLFIVLMLMICVFLLDRNRLPVFKLVALSIVLMTIMSTEAEIVSWFLMFRDMLVLFAITQLCLLFYPRERVIYVPSRSETYALSASRKIGLFPAGRQGNH